jgi:ubiquinone/menaquinone biosynthesis C-methylase UbiE
VDIGCGIGYFTISMARLVGPAGSVTAVDLQPEMLAGVERRAEKVGVRERIRLHQADASSLSLGDLRPRSVQPGDLQPADLRSGGGFDFALTFWMVHEVPDQPGLFRQIREVLRPGGHLLLVEPMVHVPRRAYITTVATAEQAGFVRERAVRVAFSRGGLFTTGGARY